MTLPDVAVNQPHPVAHNDERHFLNSLLFPNLWSIDIDPFLPPITQTNWNGIASDGNAVKNGYIQGSVQSAVIGWDIILAAGSWTISLMTLKAANYGICTVKLDGVTMGTIDCYNSSLIYNQIGSIGVGIATSGKKRLTLTNPTKNASSTAYFILLQAVSLRRTS